jgi:hypothetical protein
MHSTFFIYSKTAPRIESMEHQNLSFVVSQEKGQANRPLCVSQRTKFTRGVVASGIVSTYKVAHMLLKITIDNKQLQIPAKSILSGGRNTIISHYYMAN